MIAGLTDGVRARLLLAAGLSALAGAAGVGLMAASAWLLSRAAEHPPVLYLMVAIVGVRTFGIGRAVLRYLDRLVGHDVALRVQARLRQQAYVALSRTTWLGRRGGDLLARVVNDVAASQDLVVRAVLPLVSAAVVTTAATAMIMVLLPAAGWWVLPATVAGGVIGPAVVGRLSVRTDAAVAPLRGRLAEAVAEADAAATDLVLFDATGPATDQIGQIDATLRAAERRAAFLAGLAAAVQLLATGTAVVGALEAGGHAVSTQTLSPVLLAVLVLTPLAVHEVLSTVAPAVQALTRSTAALARVSDVLAAEPTGAGELDRRATADPAGSADPVPAGRVVVAELAAGWPGHPPVVTDLDLVVRAGERVALVGPSGVGKTTVAATVLGLLEPARGRVEVTGSVGYLAQDAHVFDTTVAENVGIGRRDATADQLAAAMAAARLTLPADRLVGAHGSRLSGGEARRLALARLLLRDDPVIVLDEPTEHIDRPTAAALMDDLCARTADRAVLVITHDPELINRCDRVVELTPVRPRHARPALAR